MEHIAEHRGRKARGVGIDDDEQRLVAEHLRTELHEGEEVILQLPDLAARAAAVARRVHDDGVVGLAAADLALDELRAVVHDPADQRVGQTADLCVLLRPCDHALGGVDVADARAALGAGDARRARVCKEVQHTDGTARLLDLLTRKVPVHRLLGKESRVLEVHGLALERQVAVTHLPLLGQLFLVPMSAAGGRAVVASLRVFPAAVRVRRLPDGLRVGTHEDLPPPALQLFAAAAVEQLVILPLVRDPHRLYLLRRRTAPHIKSMYYTIIAHGSSIEKRGVVKGFTIC